MLDTTITIVLCIMAYQDIKDREVSLFLYLLIFSLIIISFLLSPITFFMQLESIGINFVILIFIGLGVFMQLAKDKTNKNKAIGLGDVLLIIWMAFMLNPYYYVFIILSVGITSFIIYLISKLETYPAVAYMSFGYITLLIYSYIFNISLTSFPVI